MPEQEKQRVAIFVFPETREKLNLVKDQMRQAHGKTVFLDEAINALIDRHTVDANVRPAPDKRVRVARQLHPTP